MKIIFILAVLPVIGFIQTAKPRVTIYSASWCRPCQALKAHVAGDPPALRGRVVRFVDIDLDPDRADEHDVRKVPTVIFYSGGIEFGRIVGFTSGEAWDDRANKLTGARRR